MTFGLAIWQGRLIGMASISRVPGDGRGTRMPTGLIRPMLATAGALPSGAGWAYEFKWDGVRAVSYLEHDRVVGVVSFPCSGRGCVGSGRAGGGSGLRVVAVLRAQVSSCGAAGAGGWERGQLGDGQTSCGSGVRGANAAARTGGGAIVL